MVLAYHWLKVPLKIVSKVSTISSVLLSHWVLKERYLSKAEVQAGVFSVMIPEEMDFIKAGGQQVCEDKSQTLEFRRLMSIIARYQRKGLYKGRSPTTTVRFQLHQDFKDAF